MINGVLLDQATLGRDINLSCLSQLFDHWQAFEITQASDVLLRAQHAHVIVTNKVQLTREHLMALPALKVIGIAATGTNNIDMVCAKELGISVVNVKGYGDDAVAQHTFNLILQLAGRSVQYHQFIEQGKWQQSLFFSNLDFPTMELAGKTLGIIGYGGLGQATAKIAHAFGMSVVIAEHKGAAVVRDERLSFAEVLSTSDVISLHCPLSTDNVHLIDKEALSMMKPSALLINTARGPLVDEQALVNALNNQTIGGAALDVLSQEPPVDGNVLLDYQGSNLIITPHIAWAALEARQRLVVMLANNVKQTLGMSLNKECK
jgi:glycerate dehydrogenase